MYGGGEQGLGARPLEPVEPELEALEGRVVTEICGELSTPGPQLAVAEIEMAEVQLRERRAELRKRRPPAAPTRENRRSSSARLPPVTARMRGEPGGEVRDSRCVERRVEVQLAQAGAPIEGVTHLGVHGGACAVGRRRA